MKNYMRRSDRGCACICEKFKDVTVYGMRVMWKIIRGLSRILMQIYIYIYFFFQPKILEFK